MNDLSPEAAGGAASPDASGAMVYLRDSDSEAVLRQCLADLGLAAASYTSGGIENAIADLAHHDSPRLLVVDITGTAEPVTRVAELAQLCAPSTGVIIIGDTNDVVLYRQLRAEGVVEYFFKPLVANLVGETCSFILSGTTPQHQSRTGKLVTVLGVHGGVGATSIATSAGWHVAELRHRHALLLDLDLNEGDMALQLDQIPNDTLYEALQQPDRVDTVFLERGVTHVTPRLDLLASLEPLDATVGLREESVVALLANLLDRYRYVFVDLPPLLAPQLLGVLRLPGICILVSDRSLVAARDVSRWRQKIGPNTAERQTLHIVNKAGADNGLPEEEFIRAVGRAPDLVIPYNRDISLASVKGAKSLGTDNPLERALLPVLRLITGEPPEAHHSLFDRLFG
ncbi:MAG: response regulator receiver protein [Devosia sp.]|nr:response regulator receiver protein [Devosia sp.]